jgi:dihydrolipoamide dehydrogenase
MYDLFVIGAGPGGYTAAILAAKKKLKVGIAEADRLGGTCTNRGCIPAKTYIESINLYHHIRNAKRFGIEVSTASISLQALNMRKDRIVSRLIKGIELLLKTNRIDHFSQPADVSAPGTVKLDNDTIAAKHILIATGSRPKPLPFETPGLWTSDDVFTAQACPASLAIIGGGVIGCEMAHIFSSLGAKVTVIEALDRILATEDEDVSSALAKTMREVDFITSARITGIEGTSPYTITAQTPDREFTIQTEKILTCIGRAPHIPPGLTSLGIDLTPQGGIAVDDRMQTSLPGISAVGDVTGAYMFAYAASKEAEVAIDHLTGGNARMSYANIPSIVFTDPEIASVGTIITGARKGTFPVSALGRARTLEANDGFATIYTDHSNRIERVTIMAPHATELIAWASLAVDQGLTIEQFLHPHYTHPTLSELLKEAAEDVHGLSIHKV